MDPNTVADAVINALNPLVSNKDREKYTSICIQAKENPLIAFKLVEKQQKLEVRQFGLNILESFIRKCPNENELEQLVNPSWNLVGETEFETVLIAEKVG